MNHSKIPSISNAGGNFVTKKRRLSSTSMLQDVTNHVHTRPSLRHTSEGHSSSSRNSRLLNKYVFGDAKVIEEVKKRERKIIKDINHFRNAILEIEKETAQIKERQLPDVQYAISKKSTMCNELQKELAQQVSHLDLKESEIELLRKNEALNFSNLHLKWSVELQQLETQLLKEQDKKRLHWEKELLQLENMKPDEEVAQEIRDLKHELTEVEEQWQELQRANKRSCEKHESSLLIDFEKFKATKGEPMKTLIAEQNELKSRRQQLSEKHQSLVADIENCERECREIEEEAKLIQQDMNQVQELAKPLKEEYDAVVAEYERENRRTEDVKDLAHREEVFYNGKFDKMEEEQLRRKKLENSIDEMRGEIRRFAYVTDAIDSRTFTINYVKKCIGSSFFNRIIPSHLLSVDDMLSQEYEMYHNMCLGRGLNFNLISVSGQSWHELRIAVIKFLCNNCLPQYRIDLQYVFLSEEMPSQDMLLQEPQNPDKEIKLKIEKNAIELDSCVTQIEKGLDDLPLNLLHRDRNLLSGIGVLKFQLTPLITSADSHDSDSSSQKTGKPINFYFLEVHDLKMISILDSVVTPGVTIKSPIRLILKKLLSDTKSCVLFNMNEGTDNKALLRLAKKIGNIKRPRNGRISL